MKARSVPERRLAAQYAVALALAETAALPDAAPRILRAICQSLGWVYGALWQVVTDAGVLKCVETWHEPGATIANFEVASKAAKFAPGVGLPGRVWQDHRPVWIPDVVHDANFPRATVADSEGLHGALGFPIVFGSDVLGVMEFFSYDIQEPDEALLELLATVGSQIGQFIERKRAEAELDRFFNMSLDMLCISGADGYFRRVNPAWEKTLGFSREELLSRPYVEFIHPDDRAATIAAAGEVASGQDLVSFENRYACKDGSYKWLFWKATFDSEGQRAYAIARDVSERRRAEDALKTYAADLESARQAQDENQARLVLLVKELDLARHRAEDAARVKADFLANMSHEIRTPMNAVIGMTDLALATDLTAEQRNYLSTVKASARALLELVDDILDLSKVEAGKVELDRIHFDVRETTEDAIKLLAVRAGQKGLELACRIAPDVPEVVLGDPGRLRQVIVNLVGNAIKFTDRGEVVLDANVASRDEDEVRIKFSVTDSGIGVAPDKQNEIFAPFTQADSSTTRRFGGSGLGLAISTQLVELMGGHLAVDSDLGRGSTFYFTARFDLPPTEQLRAVWRTPSADLHGLSVLIVDDNATNREILCEMLTSWKMTPTVTAGGAEALKAMIDAFAAKRPFQLVLSDGQMPEMDGFMLAEAVKGHPTLRITPMILLTSAVRPDDGAHCRRLGIAGFLSKPVKQSELLDMMAAIMDKGSGTSARPVEAAPAPQRAAKPLRVLLAEDNAVNQQLATRILERRGHSVVVVSNGREAVMALGQVTDSFDVVLMDVQMPEMDGLAATRKIRAHEKTSGSHIPIVAMTAHASEEDHELCLAAGMDGYVTKPIAADQLVDTVERTAAGVVTRRSGETAPVPAVTQGRDDQRLLRELLVIFLAECPRMMSDIRAAIESSDATALRHAAHALRGSVANFAAPRAVAAARTLERMGIEGDVSEARVALAELEDALVEFRQEASKELSG